MNLASIIAANARNLSEKTAIVCGDKTLTYGEVGHAMINMATQLHVRGVRSGDRVGLAMEDHPKHLIAHYAVAYLGATIVPIDHRWTAQERRSAARSFSCRAVVTDADPDPKSSTINLEPGDVPAGEEPVPMAEVAGPRSPDLLISLSSGTTGKPTGACVSHAQLYERFINQWVAIGYDSNDCFALVTPLYFGAGRAFGMSMLAAGGTVWLLPPPHEDARLIDTLRNPSVTATFLPPTLLRRLLRSASGDALLFPNLRYLLVSGEPLHSDEAGQCRTRISTELYGYYASSEGGGICVLKPREFEEFAHTVGQPTFRTEVQIVDAQGTELPAGEIGRLRYRGPGVAHRFLDSDGTEQISGDSAWFYPGDLAEKLTSGHIRLRGRHKDVIIRGGVNIYPAEIEAVLSGHPNVGEAAVVGGPSRDKGQRVIAFIAADDRLDIDALERYCRERLAPYKVPEAFVRMESLPRRASGKLDKKLLARTAAKEHSA